MGNTLALSIMSTASAATAPTTPSHHTATGSVAERLMGTPAVSDGLILPFQPRWNPDGGRVTERNPDVAWQPDIRPQERSAWLRSLGMHEITHTDFHPFYHEIVEVVQAPDPDEPASLLETLWPSFLPGHMLFCRAGVRIRAGSHVVCKDIAEHSRMYWAYRRSNRRPVDLSHGWGSNSQWATDFRRDYVTGEAYVYNVDGRIDLNEDGRVFNIYGWGEIDEADAPYNTRPVLIELLTHRCFTLTPERTDDEFPYNLTYREPMPDRA